MSSSTSAAAFGTHSQQLQHEPCAQGKASGCGGCGCGSAPTEGMTDEEREAAASRAGVAMQAWYAEYQRTRDPLCLNVAYHHLGQMRQILAGRSPEAVARMERERGLV